MPSNVVEEICIDFASREVNRDPFDRLATVREAAPAVWNPLFERWMIARFDDVRNVLLDERRFAPDRAFHDAIFGARVFTADDNPRHRETREIFNGSFRRDRLPALEPFLRLVIRERLVPVLERLRDGETVDMVREVTGIVPVEAISQVLGVDRTGAAQFKTWGDSVIGIAEAMLEGPTESGIALRQEGEAAAEALRAFGGELLAQRRQCPADDLATVLATTTVVRSEDELRAHVALMLASGHDTTTKLLGHMLVLMANHPDQRAQVQADRSLIPQAVEEVLRFGGVIGADGREARIDTEVGGVAITAGSMIFTLPSAANRDPRRWQDPDRFDICRKKLPHLGFGTGTHICIGLNLARLEARLLLDEVLTEMPDYELADTDIQYGRNWFVRGPDTVTVTL